MLPALNPTYKKIPATPSSEVTAAEITKAARYATLARKRAHLRGLREVGEVRVRLEGCGKRGLNLQTVSKERR